MATTITKSDKITLSDRVARTIVNLQTTQRVHDTIALKDALKLQSAQIIQVAVNEGDVLLLDDASLRLLEEFEVDAVDVESLVISDSFNALVTVLLLVSDVIVIGDLGIELRRDNFMFNELMSLSDSIAINLQNTSTDQHPSDTLSILDNVNVNVGVSTLDQYVRRYLNDVA